MTTLDRYLAGRFVATLFRAMLSLLALYVVIDLLSTRAGLIQKHEVPLRIAAQYYAAMAPGIIIDYLAPFSVLVACLLVLGDAAQKNEVTAALACGISLRRLVRLPMLLGMMGAVGLFYAQDTLGVRAAERAEHIDSNYFSRNDAAERSPVSWANLSGMWTCHIMKFNRMALTGEGVLVHAFTAQRQYQIKADRIYWDPDSAQWLLERGWWQEFDAETHQRLRNQRITIRPAPFDEQPDALFALDRPPETLRAEELRRRILAAEEHNRPVQGLWVAYYTKFAKPTMSFTMVLLAIPFAMRIRRGGLAIGFGASIAIAIAYMLVFTVGLGLGQMGRIEPAVAAWAANALFLLVGLALFLRTPT